MLLCLSLEVSASAVKVAVALAFHGWTSWPSRDIRDGQDLNFNNFCAVDLPFPPTEEQRRMAVALGEATANIDTTIVNARRQIELMEEYRTRLIADVVTGKIDVRT